jgi:uncharacterized protein (TIGR03067 family)
MARSHEDNFDGYQKWLGISSTRRPPGHYELLAISPDESDPDVIRAAAGQRRQFVESKRGEGHDDVVAQIVYCIDEAEITLLKGNMRREYDQRLNTSNKQDTNRQVAGTTKGSRNGATGDKAPGIAKTTAVVAAVLCAAAAVMAIFSFLVPRSNSDTTSGNPSQSQPPAPMVVVQPADQLPESPVSTDAAAVSEEENNPITDAMKLFQGEWVCVATEGGGTLFDEAFTRKEDRRMTIQGDQLTMSRIREERQSYIGKFQIDASKGHFDFNGTGPDQAPNYWIGIYELNRDDLKLCYRKKATENAVRPTEFKTDNDTENYCMCLTFRRAQGN